METKNSPLRSKKICRFCLAQDETLSGIYDKTIYSSSKNSLSLPMQIMACISVEVFPSDGMPCHICQRCRFFMDTFYHFKQLCRQSDEQILRHIEDGFEHCLAPVLWPKKLSRLYNTMQNAQKKGNKVKTVKTESGATVQVQVSAIDLQSESEAEDDENTFKISIDDGFNHATQDPACIKVVKTSSTLKKANEQSFFNPIVAAQGTDHKYHCNYCNKVFTTHMYYIRHTQKHKLQSISHGSRGPFGECEMYRCDQCDEIFHSQDSLIYHSAKHATENLTCPLCQEKFNHVEEVSDHIKTHVDGAEFMCDLCELVFTTKEKLDQHLTDKHSEELRQEQELGPEDDSMEEDDEDDNIRIKEENGQTIVEVTPKFVGPAAVADATNSEESEVETTPPPPTPPVQTPVKKIQPAPPAKLDENKPVGILKKVEEMKRKSLQKQASTPVRTATLQKQVKPATATAAVTKAESSSPAATADKSLRLLEKELQELQRTNTNRADSGKPTPKSAEPQRPKRASAITPKTTRPQEEKKVSNNVKTPVAEKKPERRVVAAVTKENKEPKESKEPKSAPLKEDKVLDSETEKETKETPNSKATPKNNANDDLRRSNRAGKVKDYAKMIHERSSDDSTDDDEEYTQAPTRAKRSSVQIKGTPQPLLEESPTATPGTLRKRGRPRKAATKTDAPPAKLMKTNEDESKEEDDSEVDKLPQKEHTPTSVIKKDAELPAKQDNAEDPPESSVKEVAGPEKKSDVIKSPSGQTLKKVPMKALPPGVKPLPLPANTRPIQSGELCEMQIGKKMVKVQKIVMTKAEVEAMAKKGLVEVKHGTMVLKPGIKLPTSDAASIKSTLMSEVSKNSVEKND